MSKGRSVTAHGIINSIIYIVQPGISKSVTIPEKIQEVLAATSTYIKRAGKVKGLRIMGSLNKSV